MPASPRFEKFEVSTVLTITIFCTQQPVSFTAGQDGWTRLVDVFCDRWNVLFLYPNNACSSANCTTARRSRNLCEENDYADYRFDIDGDRSGSCNYTKSARTSTRSVVRLETAREIDVAWTARAPRSIDAGAGFCHRQGGCDPSFAVHATFGEESS